MTDTEKLEDKITSKIVGYANQLKDKKKKAEAARAIVYSGNGDISLNYNHKPTRAGKIKKAICNLALVAGTVIGNASYFQARHLEAKLAAVEQNQVYSAQQASQYQELATIEHQRFVNAQKTSEETQKDNTALKAKVGDYDLQLAELNTFTQEFAKTRFARWGFTGNVPWNTFVDQFCQALYGRQPPQVLKKMVVQHLYESIHPGQGQTREQIIDDWNKHSYFLRYSAEGVSK